MRPLWLRIPAGLAVLAGGVGAVALAWRTLFWWWSLAPMFFALLLAVLAPFAAWPLFAGRWARGSWSRPQQAAVSVTLAIYVLVALVALGRALSALDRRTEHAVPALVCAGWIALTATAVLMLAVIAAASPVPVGRATFVSVVGSLALIGVGGAGVAAAVASGPSGCERFVFDRAEWQRDRAPVAKALVRCRTLVGLDERELQQLLGGRLGRTRWHAGSVDDGFLGAQQWLSVRYGAGGRVRSARVYAVHI